MKYLMGLIITCLAIALLVSCGGTGTGNPSSDVTPAWTEGCDSAPFQCSDGTLVYRQGASCEFDPCP